MFSSGRFGHTNDPWFRIGNLDVSTTVAVIGLGVLSMFVWAAEGAQGAIFRRLWLISYDIPGFGSVLEGQIWRLVTWPIPNEPDFWTLILFAVFYMLGSQLENLMGRRHFAGFLLALTLVPALVVTLLELAGLSGGAAGLRFVEIGVLVAFAAHYPTARFWPGIPAWGIAIAIVVLDALQLSGVRDDYGLVLLLCSVSVSLVALRSMGYAEELHWLPKVPLPAAWGGEPRPAARPARRSRRSRRRTDLRPVPPPVAPIDDVHDREIDSLLDQVSSQGIDSLTKEQRARLEAHAERLRRRDK